MKRLIQSIIHSIFNVDGYNFNYVEIFKNPTGKEIEDTLKIDKDIRGLLYKDGTIYIWPSNFTHPAIETKGIKIDFSQYHFYTENNNYIRFHTNGNEIKYDELIKAIELSNINDIINLNNCKIEIIGLDNEDYYFEGSFKELKNLNKKIEKVSRLIKSESHHGFNYKDSYVEVFINPTLKEIQDTIKNDTENGIRGLINKDGNKYIWPSEIGHYEIKKFINKDLDTSYFRFAYEPSEEWIFDQGRHGNEMYFKELQEIIKNNLDFLSQIGDLNTRVILLGLVDLTKVFNSINDLLNY